MTKILVALLLAGVALVAVELSLGALSEPKPAIADPCHPREGRTGGFDATVQRIVLDGLDGAACRLHTSREELVLSIGGGSEAPRHWDEHTIEVALRSGLLRSVDEAEHRGDVPGFLAPALRGLVRRLPLEQLIRGEISLRDLLGQDHRIAGYLHTMYRITDPEKSRSFYEALGFTFARDMDIVRDGEVEATNYFFSMGDRDSVLELAETGRGLEHRV